MFGLLVWQIPQAHSFFHGDLLGSSKVLQLGPPARSLCGVVMPSVPSTQPQIAGVHSVSRQSCWLALIARGAHVCPWEIVMHRLPPPALRALEAHPIQCFHVCPSATGYLKLFLKKICQAPVLYPPTTGNKASSPDLRTFSLTKLRARM